MNDKNEKIKYYGIMQDLWNVKVTKGIIGKELKVMHA
jgi:hypothetical protein